MPPGARCGARGDGRALEAAPPSALAAGGADRGSRRCWPRPAPRDPRASPSAAGAGRGGGLGAGDGPGARRRSRPPPAPPRPPDSLAFPGRGLCSSLCAVPTSSAFTACTSSCSFPMARPGPQRRGCAPCARGDSEAAAAAPRHRPPPPPSPASSAARSPRRPRAPARDRAPGAEGAGSASRAGGGPGAGAGGGGREAGARHLAPPPGRLGPPPAAADLGAPAPAARPAPWLRPYLWLRPPETPPPHVPAARLRPGLCGHPAARAMAGGLDAEPRLGGDARQSPRAFQRLRDPRGEGLWQWAGGDPGTERPGHRAREPGRQRLSDISGPWLPWEVSRDCEEESPSNEFGVREPAHPPPRNCTFTPCCLQLSP